MKQRLRRVQINPRLLVGLLTVGRSFRVVRGLPPDAEIVNIDADLLITVRSSQFGEVGEEARIPFLEPPVIEVTLELNGDAAKPGGG